jgi:hypothetical protein
VIATLIPALMLAGCGTDTAPGVAASAPGAKKVSEHGLTDEVAGPAAADGGTTAPNAC